MKKITIFIFLVFSIIYAGAQEDPYVSIEIPAQNMLKFNRFMLNPTFSTVRENKSYINAYHRNQWIQYDEAFNTYLLSYSGRVGDRTGLGLSLYSQNFGTISNFGVLANYAYGLRLSERTVFTFGLNLSYYKSGFDQNQSITTEPDPRLAELQGNSLFSLQPGFNLAIGNFDFGIYAENLFDYNLKTSKSLTSFSDKTFSGHLQYTKNLKNSDGLLQNGRLMFLARGRKQADRDFNLSGSLILDLPRLGWIQGGFDDYYGVSVGLGFNLSKRISLGYTFERGVSGSTVNLGPTHEISFAYSFQPTLTDQIVLENDPFDSFETIDNSTIADSYEEIIDDQKESSPNAQNEKQVVSDSPTSTNSVLNEDDYKVFNKRQRAVLMEKDAEIEALKKNVAENNMLIDEILFRQDSLEKARIADEERRFAQLMQLIKRNSQSNVAVAENTAIPQDLVRINSKIIDKNKSSLSVDNKQLNKYYTNNIAYKEELKKNKIRSAKMNNLNGVQSGYYIIVNVFSTDKFFSKFMDKLDGQNMKPHYFLNPKNNWKYVYLKRFDTWQEAIQAHKSNLGGTYKEDKWIMNVDNGDGDDNYAYNQNAEKRQDESIAGVSNESARSSTETVNDLKTSKESASDNHFDSSAREQSSSKPLVIETEPISNQETLSTSVDNNQTKSNEPNNNNKFKEELKKNNIKSATISNLNGVQSGYYIIANVFATDKYFKKFTENLSSRGLSHNNFINNKNNWKYVYLKRYDTWQEAIAGYKSKLDGTYKEDIWIMNVDNGDADSNFAYITGQKRSEEHKKEPKIIANKIDTTDEGYYIIVNVFSTPTNADKFLKTLADKGIDADYFIDPKNNYRYVYVKKTKDLDNALYSYHTNLNSQYFDDMWIMHLTKL